MIKFDEKLITEELCNETVKGKVKEYSFYKHYTETAKIHITGKNCICIATNLNYLGENLDNFVYYIDYHEDLKTYMNKNTSSLNSLFKTVNDKSKAEEIIADIKANPKINFLL